MVQSSNGNLLDKIVSLAKRRGFIFPGSEIYGGLANSWDFGHPGNELFNNIASLWWKEFVQKRTDMIGLRGTVIMNPKVWEASGHLQNFTDPLVECKVCHQRFRADEEDGLKEHAKSHKEKVEWTKPKNFNLLFKTFIGPAEDSRSTAYLRGELAQTMFTDFKIAQETNRKKLPFGIAQIGKAFRNEITTGNFIFRTKEFTIAELEYFVRPGDEDEYFKKWLDFICEFSAKKLGIKKEMLRFYEHPKSDLAHYSKGTTDIEYNFPWGWGEVWGIASRTDFDLKNHEKFSGQNLKYKDPESGEEFWPYVIEPTVGLERLMLAVLIDSYDDSDKERIVLKIKPDLAPFKVAVFPLLANKPELVEKAKEIYEELIKDFSTAWDDRGNIGKRYYSQDEIGTPYCVTFDFDSLDDKKVTVRDRDTTRQERISISDLKEYISKGIFKD